MKKLVLFVMAMAMVMVAFSSIALGENRHRPMPLRNKITGREAGIQGTESQKVPEFPSSTGTGSVALYASFSIPEGDEIVDGQPYCGVGSGDAAADHTFLIFGIGVRSDGSLVVKASGTSPVAPEACSTLCTPLPTEGFSGTFTLDGVLFNLLLIKVNQAPGFATSTAMRLRVRFGEVGILQLIPIGNGVTDACGL